MLTWVLNLDAYDVIYAGSGYKQIAKLSISPAYCACSLKINLSQQFFETLQWIESDGSLEITSQVKVEEKFYVMLRNMLF